MSIDAYTGVKGGGAVAQLYKRLQARQDATWRLIDETYDGCLIRGVPLTHRPGGVDLVTVTIGGNDLLQNMGQPVEAYRQEFEQSYCRLLGRLQKLGRHKSRDTGIVTDATVIVGNIYQPAGFAKGLQAALDAVNGFIGEKVAAYGFHLADIAGAFLGHEGDYLCYGIEPTLKGASVITDLFERAAFGG
jgi:lysophospholipase L1-like esterase